VRRRGSSSSSSRCGGVLVVAVGRPGFGRLGVNNHK